MFVKGVAKWFEKCFCLEMLRSMTLDTMKFTLSHTTTTKNDNWHTQWLIGKMCGASEQKTSKLWNAQTVHQTAQNQLRLKLKILIHKLINDDKSSSSNQILVKLNTQSNAKNFFFLHRWWYSFVQPEKKTFPRRPRQQ